MKLYKMKGTEVLNLGTVGVALLNLYTEVHVHNKTQRAALAKVPLTTHLHEWAEPHTLQTQFTLQFRICFRTGVSDIAL